MSQAKTSPQVTECAVDGITVQQEKRDDGPRGLGDFQRRLNRDQFDRRGNGRRDDRRGWDATPRSERGGGSREDAPSVRVPNVGWDSTPRRSEDGAGWGNAKTRRWDAPTPRGGKSADVDDDESGPVNLDMREWEEEQIKLDRDWYMGPEEGNMAGDEDFNPLAQYDDLSATKEAELAKRAVVCSLRINLINCTLKPLVLFVEKDICEAGSIRAFPYAHYYITFADSDTRMRTTTSGKPTVWSRLV